MGDLQKAYLSVPSLDQTKPGQTTYMMGNPDGSPRIIVVGNSITYHPPKAEVMWEHNWGMAASCAENDYVHRLYGKVKEIHPDAAFCVCQAAKWERNLHDINYNEEFQGISDYAPDIIIFLIGANMPPSTYTHDSLKQAFGNFVGFLTKSNKDAKVIMTTGFYDNPTRRASIVEFAEENGYPVVETHHLSHDEENHAIGLFEHEGVQHHPGDLGMERIADIIWETLKTML